MEDLTKGLSSYEREALNSTASARPLRASNPKVSGRMENIMQSCMVRVASAHMDFLAKVFEAINAPALNSIRSGAKAVLAHEQGCLCCENAPALPTITKADSPSLGFSIDRKITEAANQLFSDLWGITDIHATTILQKSLYELVNEALKDGYAQAETAWEKRAAKDKTWAESNPFPKSRIQPTEQMGWLRDIQESGFTNVKDKIFQQLIPDLKQSIFEQVAAGLSPRDIAANLYSQFGPNGPAGPWTNGSGYLWQWQRLVRTEAHNAIFTANNAEFKDCGAKWIRWSAAINRCNICDGIQSKNQGYYPIDECPRPPHPNCRCSTTPVFNLPQGISDTTTQPQPTTHPITQRGLGVGEAGTGRGRAQLKLKNRNIYDHLSKDELLELQQHATQKLKEFGINDDISVELFFKEGKYANHGGYVNTLGTEGAARSMYLGYGNVSVDEMKKIISHELKHVQQMNSGRLYVTNTHEIWEGEEFISLKKQNETMQMISSPIEKIRQKAYKTYESWPWEVEANAAM